MSYRDSDTRTTISSDGLRYTERKPGSAFGPITMATGLTTMSCFKCGSHRPMFKLVSTKILGRNEKVCAAGCRTKS